MTPAERSRIQKEIVDSIPPNPRGRLCIAQRVGKTKIVIDLIKREKPTSILWVSPSRKLLNEDIPSEFAKWKAKKYLKVLDGTTWASLKNKTAHYDMIILDEDHKMTESNSITLRNGQLTGGSIISMTGTPSKTKSKIALYKALELPMLFTMSLNEAVDLGILSNYTINVLQVPLIPYLAKKYAWIERQILGLKVGTSELNDEGTLCVRGNIVLDLETDFAKEVDKGIMYYVKFDGRNIGYYVSRNDGSNRGKISLGNGKLEITDNIAHRPAPKSLLVGRQSALGGSVLKTHVVKDLLKELAPQRTMVFAHNITQAEALSKHTYHSKTNGDSLRAFQQGEVNLLTLVNSGGTGYTYEAVDNLILVQADSDQNGTSSQKISRTLLQQPDYKANIYLICVKDTQDEVWIERTLQSFDSTKVKYIDYEIDFNKSQN